MMQQAALKTKTVYLSRLLTLYEVIESIPARQFNLDDVGIYVGDKEYGPNFTTEKVLACGSVGCILGWARTIPAARQWVKKYYKGTSDWDAYAKYYKQNSSFFSSATQADGTSKSCRARGLRRIAAAIERLGGKVPRK